MRAAKCQAGWLDSRHTFSFGALLRPAVDGLRPAARDQRGPRRARRGLPAAPPRQHGNPQLRAGGRAGASRRQRRRRRDPRRRTAVDERRPRHRAQRVQRHRQRAGAFPADLDPARSRSTPRRPMRSAAFDRRRDRGRWACWHRPMARTAASAIRQEAWLRGVRLDAGESRRAARWIRRDATGCMSRRARSTSTAARSRPAMRWAWPRKPARCALHGAATALPTCCCSTCRR